MNSAPIERGTVNGSVGDTATIAPEALRLNLGCGLRKIPGFVGVDIHKTEFTDVVHDLEKFPWPFGESSVHEVVLVHVLEHIQDIVGVMTELYRVMEPEGRVGIEGPHWTSVGSWQDPDHKHALSEEFFHYFDADFRKDQKIHYIPEHVNFKLVNAAYDLHPDYKKRMEEKTISKEEIEFAMRHNVNVITNFGLVLKAVK